jgi:AraC-like DNA-binding protein
MSSVQAAVDERSYERVYARLLRFFPELVCELSGDPDRLLRRFGLQPRAPELDLTYRTWVGLLEQAALELQCPDFGMRLARLQTGGHVLGPMGTVMKHSNTFGEAIAYVASHVHAHSLAAGVRLERDEQAQTLFVSHEILLDGLPNRRQALEQALLLAHLNAIALTSGRARVREVRFRHQPLSSLASYRAQFGSSVRFDQREDGVVFSDEDLRAPIVGRDAQLYWQAASFVDARFGGAAAPMHVQVRAWIVRLLETDRCSNDDISARLGVHPRTLHRRLKAEGRSFESIKDDVRRDVALRFIQETDHSFTFIAEKLGYAEQSVLTRSCLRWFDAAPSQLRARS